VLEYELEMVDAVTGEDIGLLLPSEKLGIYNIIVPKAVPSIKATPKSAIIFLFI
jgi:hypothetical protein